MTHKTIVVLGCPRSDTSMIAGMLRCMGIYMGENIKADKHEDTDILWQPKEKIIETINKRNLEQEVWGFKDPNCAQYLDDILPLLINPLFIYIVRNGEAAIESDLRRNKKAVRENVIARNNRYTRKYEDTALSYPCLRLQYEDVVDKPLKHSDMIAEFIDENIGVQEIVSAECFVKPGNYRTID